MKWKPAPAFEDRHPYEPGDGPRDVHPRVFGKLERHWFGQQPPGLVVAVHSTRRRPDGWSYNVAIERDRPEWCAWFHHREGSRILHANSPGAVRLARLFRVAG